MDLTGALVGKLGQAASGSVRPGLDTLESRQPSSAQASCQGDFLLCSAPSHVSMHLSFCFISQKHNLVPTSVASTCPSAWHLLSNQSIQEEPLTWVWCHGYAWASFLVSGLLGPISSAVAKPSMAKVQPQTPMPQHRQLGPDYGMSCIVKACARAQRQEG